MPRADDGHQDDDGPVFVDDDHAELAAFAEKWLDDDERDPFVEHLMERHGYERIQGWGPRRPPDPPAPPEPSAPAEPARGRGASQRGSGKGPQYFKR